jgi:hypothetical protein
MSSSLLIEQANAAIDAMLKDGEFAALASAAHMTICRRDSPTFSIISQLAISLDNGLSFQ